MNTTNHHNKTEVYTFPSWLQHNLTYNLSSFFLFSLPDCSSVIILFFFQSSCSVDIQVFYLTFYFLRYLT